MKCPNCNNEALYVNGKYVCVDCGIEITPEQQAAQAGGDSFDSVLGDGLDSVKKDTDSTDAGAAPSQTAVPEDNSPKEEPTKAPSGQTSDRPVEEYYKGELASNEPTPAESASPTSDSGVYDFDNKSADQPANQPTAQPVGKPPVDQLADEPVNQPAEKTIDQFEKPTSDQLAEQPVSQTTDESAKQFSNQSIERPTGEPTSQPPEGPVSDQPVEQPDNKPTEQFPDQSAEQQTDQPINKPAGQPPAQPIEQPIEEPTNQFSEGPVSDQPAEKPAGQPLDKPVGQPLDQPAEQALNKPQETESQPVGEPTSEFSSQDKADSQVPEPNMPKEVPSSVSPEDSEKKDPSTEHPPVVDGSQPQEYFSPNTFNLGEEAKNRDQVEADKDPQAAGNLGGSQGPEGTSSAFPNDYPTPPKTDQAGEPTIDDLQAQGQVEEPGLPEPESPTQNTGGETGLSGADSESKPGDETTESFSEPKSLDEMLNESEKRPSSGETNTPETQNVDGFSQPHKKDPQGNIPSVESVFGSGDSGSETPTPQDFGLPAPDPRADSRKKMITIGAIAGGALLIIVVLLFVFLGRGRSPYPIQLSEENITTLSSKVSEVMDKPQDMTVSYEVKADFSELMLSIANEDELAGEEASDKKDGEIDEAETSYEASGLWLLDEDDNVYLSKDVGERSIKQSFIESENATYTYNEKEDKWNEKEEYQISAIPPFIDPQNKSSIIYASSIDQAFLVDVEHIDGVEARVYEIKPQRDFVKNLEFMGGVFSDADYTSTDASKLTFKVSVGAEDNRIYRTDLSGDLSVEGEDFSGTIFLTASAEYEYKKVLIRKPRETASGDPPYTVTIDDYKGEEEVEASSVNTKGWL